MKSKILVISVLGFLCFYSCGSKDDEFKDLYEDPMTLELMIDLYVGEVVVGKFHSSEKDSIRKLTRSKILGIYELTQGQLDSMMVYLQSDLGKYAKLNKMVSDSLNARQKRLQSDKD